MFNQWKCALLSVLIILGFNSHAQSKDLEIRHARINATIPGMQTTAAYFDLINHTDNSIVLESASSNISNRVELHEHQMREGLMHMQKVEMGIGIKAGEIVSFEPGGHHIMLMNLEKSVREGEVINIILHFAGAETLTLEATAEKASAEKKHRHH